MLSNCLKNQSGKGGKPATLVLICATLAILVIAVYWQAGSYQFLNLDDNVYVSENTHVAKGLTGPNIVWAFTSVEASNWHPLTWLSHMADVQLFGMNPRGHHLANVAIHAVSTLILFLLLFRLTGAPWPSSFVAAMFALHPLHVESVAWVAERKDVLSALFWSVTLLLYAEYVARRQVLWYLLALFAFALGLMAKPMLVTLPLVMLLIDCWPLGRLSAEHGPRHAFAKALPLLSEKIPFLVCASGSAIITIYAQNKGGSIASLASAPFKLRVENALIAYITYIGKIVWPQGLAINYPLPLNIPLWQAGGALAVLLLVSAAAIRARRSHPYLAIGWFWYLITLVPVIGIVQVGSQALADRYSYIPATGLFIMAAWGVPVLFKGWRHRRAMLAALAGTVIITAALLTRQQLGYWRNDFTLYQHSLRITAGNFLIHNNLGFAFQAAGNLDAAIPEYKKSIAINPYYKNAHNNLGVALDKAGFQDDAIAEFRLALQIDPDYSEANLNLGGAFANKGYLNDAIQVFEQMVRRKPQNPEAHYNLGLALGLKGNQEGAIREYRETIRIKPDHDQAQTRLRQALADFKEPR
jgi:tetratricopeptide (TPR) repeat protein